ncbi:MAG: hypothetical protein AB7F75_06095 [Planctomycetota bacterium]
MTMRRVGISFLLALLTWMLGWDAWIKFWSSNAPSGWDAGGHEGLITLIRNHADWPFHGVFKEWFAGMPFPHFLPPLFHVLAAGLSALIEWGSFEAARWLLTLSILILPIQVVFLSHRLMPEHRVACLMAGVLAAIQVTDFTRGACWGLGLHGVLYSGLLSYVAIMPFWMGAIQCLVGPLTPMRTVMGGVLLSATIVGNPHIAVASAMGVLGCLMMERNWRKAFVGLAAVALAGVWWWPMLERQAFFPTRRLPPAEINQILEALPGLVIPALWGLLSLPRTSRYRVACLGSSLLAVMLAPGVEDWPLQPHRLLGPFILLLCLPAGAGLASLARLVSPRLGPAMAILLLLPYGLMRSSGKDETEIVDTQVMGDVLQVADFCETAGGTRYMIEPMDRHWGPHPSGRPGIFMESNLLESRLAGKGCEILTSVFRESALLAMFSVPVRNAIASARIHYGLDSHLVEDSSFLDQPPDRTLMRAAELGTTHWLVHSPPAIASLEGARLAHRKAILGRWHLFELREPRPPVEVPPVHPAWVVARWNAKRRLASDLDWLRVSELLFAHGGEGPLPVWPGTQCLDDILPTPGPNTLVLMDYEVRDCSHVQAQLSRHVENGGAIVYDRSRPGSLASWLQKHRADRVVGLDFGRGGVRSNAGLDVESLAAVLNQLAVSVEGRGCTLTHPDHRSLAIDLPKGNKVPILVRYAWGPDWHAMNGAALHLGGPGFMVLYADGPETLAFRTTGLALGYGITLLGLTALVMLAWSCPRPPSVPMALEKPREGF